MALVRILVDGYSLLYGWPDLAPGKPRHSAAAREELAHILTLYHDVIGTPITIVFDGRSGAREPSSLRSSDGVEILFSKTGQTADQIIERVTHRIQPYGEVLAVTDDHAERDTVISLGGMASNCDNFIATIQMALKELESDVKRLNQRERTKFKRT